MNNKIEKDWINFGFRCVVLGIKRLGHRCGYVGVSENNPLYKVGYSEGSECLVKLWEQVQKGSIGNRGILPILCHFNKKFPSPDIVFDVHGGITYSGSSEKYPVPNDGILWWFGFDAGHVGDASDPNLNPTCTSKEGVIRTLDYMVNECNKLAFQLTEVI